MIRTATIFAALLVAAAARADDGQLLDEARRVAASIPPKLLEVLRAEIDAGGPAAAIAACNEKAPKMAAAASEKTGWQIRRVSLRNRNPKAVPDAWEAEVLREFDRRAAAGEDPAQLEKGALVGDGAARSYRYMRALPTQELCVNCHGPAEQLRPEVRARIGELYPEDQATGFSVGQIRGAITLRRAM